MAVFSTHNPSAFAFGLLGNIVSFVVFLAPVPTFIRVCRKKSTEGFQSVPYVISLFSAMVWLYYASLKSDAFLLITINSVGCLIESIYIAIFITYAPKQARMFTMRLLVFLNIGGFCLILLLSHLLVQGSKRVTILGWICVIFSVSVFASPLSIIRLVIRTKSVEFMPFSLSFFLTLSAVMWLFYGILLKDFYIAVPNILGFAFGMVQMILYVIYKHFKKVVVVEQEEERNGVVENVNINILTCQEVQQTTVCSSSSSSSNSVSLSCHQNGASDEQQEINKQRHKAIDPWVEQATNNV